MLSRMPFSGRIAVLRLRCHFGHVLPFQHCHFRPKATTALFKHRTKAEAETPSDRPAGMRSRRPSYAIPKTVLCHFQACHFQAALRHFQACHFQAALCLSQAVAISQAARCHISGYCHISGRASPYLRRCCHISGRCASLPFSGRYASPFSGGAAIFAAGSTRESRAARPPRGRCASMPYLRLLPYLRLRFAISQAVLPYLRLCHISGGIAISQASPSLRRRVCGHTCGGGARDSRAMPHWVSMNRRRRTEPPKRLTPAQRAPASSTRTARDAQRRRLMQTLKGDA